MHQIDYSLLTSAFDLLFALRQPSNNPLTHTLASILVKKQFFEDFRICKLIVFTGFSAQRLYLRSTNHDAQLGHAALHCDRLVDT